MDMSTDIHVYNMNPRSPRCPRLALAVQFVTPGKPAEALGEALRLDPKYRSSHAL